LRKRGRWRRARRRELLSAFLHARDLDHAGSRAAASGPARPPARIALCRHTR